VDDDVTQGRAPVADSAGLAVLSDAANAYQARMGPRLLAVYALGSLAHGGFSPVVSDVDVGLVLTDPLRPSDPDHIKAVAEAVKAGATPLHERLSVFWDTPSTVRGQQTGGRFPPLDLLDLIEHGLLVAGEDIRRTLPSPTREELLVAGAEFALDFLAGIRSASPSDQDVGSMRPADDSAVEQIRRPEALLARGVRRLTKLILFPTRFLYTAETGSVGTNQSAAEHYLAADGPAAALVSAALGWRTTPPDHEVAAALLREQMIPLYLHYIDDHETRLAAAGRLDLTGAFKEWRRRILE
jgi:hypothetical protein